MEKTNDKTAKGRFKGDRIMLIIVLLLSVISMLMVYSTEGQRVTLSHGMFIVASYVAMFLLYIVDYKLVCRFAILGIVGALALLIISFTSSAVRGLTIAGRNIQTYYIIGMLVITYLSTKIARIRRDGHTPTGKETLLLFGILSLFCGGIATLNMSTAIILFLTGLAIFFVGGIKKRYIAALLGFILLVLGILSAVAFSSFKEGKTTGIGRMDTFVRRFEYYLTKDNSDNYGDQMVLSRSAIARSGLKPAGPGKGVIKYRLPENSTDYAFASIVEETGIYLGIPIIFLYLAYFYRAREIAKKAQGTLGALLAFGIGFWLTTQALVHIGVNCDLLPSTGQTLPFISKGGMSLIVTGAATGILMNICKQNNEANKLRQR